MFGREKLAGCDSALRLALSRYLHSESRSEAQAEVESAANAAQNKCWSWTRLSEGHLGRLFASADET